MIKEPGNDAVDQKRDVEVQCLFGLVIDIREISLQQPDQERADECRELRRNITNAERWLSTAQFLASPVTSRSWSVGCKLIGCHRQCLLEKWFPMVPSWVRAAMSGIGYPPISTPRRP